LRGGVGAPRPASAAARGSPSRVRHGWERRKKGRREIGGAYRGKMVISAVGLTPFAHKIDGMAHV
jgi:hypothetical protein